MNVIATFISICAHFMGRKLPLKGVLASFAFMVSCLLSTASGLALEPIVLTPDIERIEITQFSEHYKERGDTLQVETAVDSAGISNRMAVKAQTPGTDPKWIVFALKNPTDKQIVRLVTARRYNLVGSRILRPDLDAQRIVHLTPLLAFCHCACPMTPLIFTKSL